MRVCKGFLIREYMNEIAKKINGIFAAKQSTSLMWMGQAGFIIVKKNGIKIAVDLYLSECCERYFGFKRQMATPILPSEIKFDAVLATHSHYDHFDIDSMPWFLSNDNTRLVCTKDCLEECERLNLKKDKITVIGVGEQMETVGITVKAVACDHGEFAPEAVGLLLTVDGKRIYFMGDTAYRPDYLEDGDIYRPDVLILPANGAFGNLSEEQASQIASILRPKLTIPCHIGMFTEHGGDYKLFEQNMKSNAPGCEYKIPVVGEAITL